jgi:retron-type reverse transcriptase
MITHANLWPAVVSFDALYAAYVRARRGKRTRPQVQRFEQNLEGELIQLQNELVWGEYRTGRHHRFEVYEPKRREVVSLPFRDRVVQHALVAQLEPIWERSMIDDTYACRPGRGIHACADRVQSMLLRTLRRSGRVYALKADVRSYFASIDHGVLKRLLRRKVRCARTLALCDEIIDAWGRRVVGAARGLPIGNLTSQLWANVYLDALDQRIKHGLRAPSYARYMDDFVLVSGDKGELQRCRMEIERWLADELRLELNAKTQVFPVAPRHGRALDFVGYRIWPTHRRLRTSSIRRIKATLRRMQREYAQGDVTLAEVRERVQSWVAHASHANTDALREQLLGSFVFSRPGPVDGLATRRGA